MRPAALRWACFLPWFRPRLAAAAPAGLKAGQQPAAFIRIDANGLVTVQANRLEFGQGTLTGLAMIAAEELDADWTQVRAELAPAGEAYKDLGFGIQMTGGSSALANSYMQYRELGARMRAMLVTAAARRFKVKEAEVSVASGVLSAGSQRAGFGEMAAAAMQLPVPEKVVLKDHARFSRIGKPTGRLDAVAKSTGQQAFGIDARAPGMKTVLLVHPPVFGAQLKSFELPSQGTGRNAVVAMKVALDRGATGVAVIGDGYWRTKQAREALKLEWDTSGVEKVDTERQLAAYKVLATQPGLKVRPADTSKIASAPKRITAEYSFPYLAHAPMEPLNCLIELNDAGCKLQVGSQFQTIDQATVAGVLGLKPEQVTADDADGRRRFRPPCRAHLRLPGRGRSGGQGLEGRGPQRAPEADLEPGGRHPRRLLPADARAPCGDRP